MKNRFLETLRIANAENFKKYGASPRGTYQNNIETQHLRYEKVIIGNNIEEIEPPNYILIFLIALGIVITLGVSGALVYNRSRNKIITKEERENIEQLTRYANDYDLDANSIPGEELEKLYPLAQSYEQCHAKEECRKKAPSI
jgi:hypothetical protein